MKIDLNPRSVCGASRRMGRSGFTLIELLVYIAILGGIILVAGQVFKDSTSIKVRTQNMLRANHLAGTIAGLIVDDVAQMGVKVTESSKWSGEYSVVKEAFIDPDNANENLRDYSSFVLKKNDATLKDSLYFRVVRYDDDGKFVAVDAVSWYVADVDDNNVGKLMRKCRRIKKETGVDADLQCPENEDVAVVMAENVSKFTILPAKPSQLTGTAGKLIFPAADSTVFRLVPRIDGVDYFRINVAPAEGGSSVEISNFVSNYTGDKEESSYSSKKRANQLYAAEANSVNGTWKDLCAKLKLEAGQEYEVSFSMPLMDLSDLSQTFVPEMDHMAVGIRKADGSTIPRWRDFLFYPPEGEMAGNVNRSFRFSVENDVEDACLAFTFAFYSPLVNVGKMTIGALKVRKLMDVNYSFDPSFKLDRASDIPDKKLVRAFQMNFEVNIHGETGSVKQVISTPSNGSAVE